MILASINLAMMTYDFFADESDKIEILKFIFAETDLQIFDLSSECGQKINKYNSLEEITNKFDLINGDQFACTFHLWSSLFDGEVIFNRIDLNPKSCKGHTFRYNTNGWGLILLYFGGLRNNLLRNSHIGHFNKAGAFAREDIPEFMGRQINGIGRKLKKRPGN